MDTTCIVAGVFSLIAMTLALGSMYMAKTGRRRVARILDALNREDVQRLNN